MKGLFVHSDSSSGQRRKIMLKGVIGIDDQPLGKQLSAFADIPLVFCNYFCSGYKRAYGSTGVVFGAEEPVVYACPADSFELMREGNYLPGHERFVFTSIEEMLKKYPSSKSFRQEFQVFFKSLNPKEIYPHVDSKEAAIRQRLDYCQRLRWPSEEGCNEITFIKPLTARILQEFNDLADLKKLLTLHY